MFILRSHHLQFGLHALGLLTPVVSSLVFAHTHTHTCANVQGTLFNALAVGACVYGVGAAGILKAHWMPAAALLFGVITSAVDPVAVSDVICSHVCVQCTCRYVCTSDHIQCMQRATCSSPYINV